MEKSIEINTELGIMELRQLMEFSKLNNALTKEEYFRIVMVYKTVIDRLTKKAEEQGIEI